MKQNVFLFIGKFLSNNEIVKAHNARPNDTQLYFLLDEKKRCEKLMALDVNCVYLNLYPNDKGLDSDTDELFNRLLGDKRLWLFKDRFYDEHKFWNFTRSSYSFHAYVLQLIITYKKIVNSYNITYIFFTSTPHQIESYILGKVGEYHGCDVLIWQNLFIGNLAQIRLGLDFPYKLLINPYPIEQISTENIVTKWIDSKLGGYSKSIPDYEAARFRKNRGKYFHLMNEVRSYWRKPYLIWNKYQCYKKYINLSMPQTPENKYVIYFLHYQPERTSLPEGGRFTEQIYTIRYLRYLIPDNYTIVVKEHPSTFTNLCHPRFRDPNFYEILASIPGVQLVSLDSDNFRFIDESACVFSLTGTVILEALLRGIPAVYLGLPRVVRSFTGLHIYRDDDSLSKFINTLDDLKKEAVRDAIRRYYYSSTFGGSLYEKGNRVDMLHNVLKSYPFNFD